MVVAVKAALSVCLVAFFASTLLRRREITVRVESSTAGGMDSQDIRPTETSDVATPRQTSRRREGGGVLRQTKTSGAAKDRRGSGSYGEVAPSVHFIEPSWTIVPSNLGAIVEVANFPPRENISVALFIDGALVGTKENPPYSWGSCSGEGAAPDPELWLLKPGTYEMRAEGTSHTGDDVISTKAEIVVTVQEPTTFSSGYRPYDEAYVTARSEADRNVECGRFIAGAGWTQLWTRDTSFAIDLLSGGMGYAEAAKASLEACTEVDGGGVDEREVWLQDVCGHFNGWPNLSDAIVGAQGAWSLYLQAGNRTFLSWAYDVTKASLARAERDVYDRKSGLFLGCSSFMESNSGYPSRYAFDGSLVGRTKALSTNILYYLGYHLGADMGTELGAGSNEISSLRSKAGELRQAVRSQLWLPGQGHYGYFEDERAELVPNTEGLGTALALLAPGFETDTSRVDGIFNAAYRSKYGLPSLWPRFSIRETDDIASYYHNGRIWPFVSGYWSIAAARHGRIDDFAKEFDSLAALRSKSGTFAEFYELDGQSPTERRRQLWSDAGFLGSVHRGLFGMELGRDGVRFHPTKPSEGSRFAETLSLRNVRYRDMVLHVYVSGTGNKVGSFVIDGIEQIETLIPCQLTGEHTIKISLVGREESLLSR